MDESKETIPSPDDLLHEVEEGKSGRTPFLLWGGMYLLIGAVVVVLAAVLLVVYYLIK